MTSIEWVRGPDGSKGHSWNMLGGCSRHSPGCDNCYAMLFEHRFSGEGQRSAGLTIYREGGKRPGVDWSGQIAFMPERLAIPLRRRRPTMYFPCSTSDLFHVKVRDEWIAAVFGVMAATPHTYQILTKRAGRLPEWFAWAHKRGDDGLTMFPHDPLDWRIRQLLSVSARRYEAPTENHGGPWPLPNVWLGVSAEDQATADYRWDALSRTPAAVRTISMEPMLGPISISHWKTVPDWIIVGGEAGRRPRPFHIEWAHRLRDECAARGVRFFLKQFGANVHAPYAPGVTKRIRLKHRKGSDMDEWPANLRVRQMPERAA